MSSCIRLLLMVMVVSAPAYGMQSSTKAFKKIKLKNINEVKYPPFSVSRLPKNINFKKFSTLKSQQTIPVNQEVALPQQSLWGDIKKFFTFKKQAQQHSFEEQPYTGFARAKFKTEQETQQKNPQSYWKKLLGIIGMALIGGTVATMEEDAQKKNSHWRTISKESLNALYEWGNGFKSLFIPREELKDSPNTIAYLKELFDKNNIDANYDALGGRSATQRSEDDWIYTEDVFKKRAKKGLANLDLYNIPYVTLDKSQLILQDAKTLLKSFLSTNASESALEGIEKFNLGRLFTYAKLEQIIEENNLSHIHLPKKNLIIKDKRTGKLIEGKEASRIVDEVVKIGLCGRGNPFAIFISGWSDKYELKILAERMKRGKPGLNAEAYNELKILVAQAPFDIGHDNIFTDDQGNAVIIDTEFKGEPAEHSIPKLKRYI